ncbi:hypothetical protein TA3x_001098 [Tundrisphaera sp. TA3]|uniref:hypothetical protein n=1 Tax=Tundrisphaera sp. TA3 TaxID=3435775 RepID=UPI003EBC54CF
MPSDIDPRWLLFAAILLWLLVQVRPTGWRPLRKAKPALPVPGGLHIGPVYLPPDVATQGVIVYGQPGSGKSHFLLSKIRELARSRQPMVITTVRRTDYADIEKIFREENRLDMLRRSCPSGEWRLNIGRFFSDPQYLPGASPRLLAHYLSVATEVMNDSTGGKQQDEFWSGFFKEMTLMSARLLILAQGFVDLSDLYEVIMSIPGSLKEAASAKFYRDSFCGQMLELAKKNRRDETDRDYTLVVNFMVIKAAGVGPRARTAVQQMATNTLSGLISDEFYEALCTDSTITPRAVEEGRLAWILDYPLMVWHGSGRVYQFLHIAAMDEMCMARDPRNIPTVMYKIRDEGAYVCVASHDVRVQAVSRAQKLASIIAVQNLPLLETQLGGAQKGHQEAIALSSVHNTRIFFKNSCPETGDYGQKLCGDTKELMISGGGNGQESTDIRDIALGVKTGTFSWAEHYEPAVRKERFSKLDVGTCIMHGHDCAVLVDLRETKGR